MQNAVPGTYTSYTTGANAQLLYIRSNDLLLGWADVSMLFFELAIPMNVNIKGDHFADCETHYEFLIIIN